MTVDVDFKLDPEPQGVFEALPKIKDKLNINVELASPDNFIPTVTGWKERSVMIARHGKIEFYHYDFYSQALAKIERYHFRDELDVKEMFRLNLINKIRLEELFKSIEPELIRYPAIEPDAFRERVFALTSE